MSERVRKIDLIAFTHSRFGPWECRKLLLLRCLMVKHGFFFFLHQNSTQNTHAHGNANQRNTVKTNSTIFFFLFFLWMATYSIVRDKEHTRQCIRAYTHSSNWIMPTTLVDAHRTQTITYYILRSMWAFAKAFNFTVYIYGTWSNMRKRKSTNEFLLWMRAYSDFFLCETNKYIFNIGG